MNYLIDLKPDSKITVIVYMRGDDILEQSNIKGYKIVE